MSMFQQVPKQNIPAELHFQFHAARRAKHSLCPLSPHPARYTTGTRVPQLNLRQQMRNWIDQWVTNLWIQTDLSLITYIKQDY
jgi:hypothetical protein